MGLFDRFKDDFEQFAGNVEQLGEQTVQVWGDKAEKIAGEVYKEITEGLSAESLKGLHKIVHAEVKQLEAFEDGNPEIVALLNQPGAEFELSPFVLEYHNFYLRGKSLLSAIERQIEDPPALSRFAIRNMLLAFAPDKVAFGTSAKAAIPFVDLDVGKFGFKLKDIPPQLFVNIIDKKLEAWGVPE